MPAYLYSAPAGVPGDITRADESDVEPVFLGSPAPTAFGVPVAMIAGQAVAWQGSNVAADFAGILVREVPSISNSSSNEGFNQDTPYVKQVQGLCPRGYINVICTVGTPVRFGNVYVRVIAASGKLVGDIEASADGSNSVLLTNASWAANGKDANNIAELRINIAR